MEATETKRRRRRWYEKEKLLGIKRANERAEVTTHLISGHLGARFRFLFIRGTHSPYCMHMKYVQTSVQSVAR